MRSQRTVFADLLLVLSLTGNVVSLPGLWLNAAPDQDSILSYEPRPRGPSFTAEPTGQLSYTNDTGLEVKCLADGHPRPRVHWVLRDGSPAEDLDGLRYVRHDGTLVIRPFTADQFRREVHTTVYKCMVSNEVGTLLSRDVNVKAVVRQNYEPQALDAFAFRGNVAVLRCSVPASLAADVSVDAWIRDDGHVLDRKGTLEDSFTFLRSGELLLHNVIPQVSGRHFGCRTRHLVTGEQITSPISARVIITEPPNRSPPRMLLHRARIAAPIGTTAELPCVAEGNPSPTYRWIKSDNHRHHAVKSRMWLRDGLLTLRNLRHEDSGLYACIIENGDGQLKLETQLVVTEVLEAQILPAKQVVDIGKTLTLNCTVRGHPLSSVVWLKDGRPVVTSSRVSHLTQTVLQLKTVQRDDQGMYQCVVQNEQDSAQASVEIAINDVPPTFLSVLSTQTAHPKSPVSLTCSVSGSPAPHVTWTLDGLRLHTNDRVSVDSAVTSHGYVSSTVNISETRVEDSGEYQCHAKNEVGSVQQSARLNIFGPIFVRPLTNLTAVSGQVIHMRCPYGGFPIKGINWSKGGVSLPVTARMSLSDDGVLTVSGVERESDAGEYRCQVQSEAGHMASGTTFLSVQVAPVIDTHYFPDTVTADEGSRSRLMCSISKGDPPVSLRWLKNGLPLNARKDMTVHSTEDTSIVSFRKVSAEDSGLYTCVASNTAATSNRTLHLNVNVPPRWVVPPSNASVTERENLRLHCVASGHPTPSITWQKAKGSSAANFSFIYSSSRVQQFSNGSLLVRDAEQSDRGFYLCSANNGVGTGTSAVIFVGINVPPRIATKFRTLTKKRGEEALLSCEAVGDLPATVTWRRTSQLIDPLNKRYTFLERTDEQKLTAEFFIRQLAREDTGLYNCQVNNSYGRDEAHYQVTVQDVPGTPYNLTVVNITNSAVTLSWEIPSDGNSPIKRYLIYYKEQSASWQPQGMSEPVPVSKTLATVRNLSPITAYHLAVSAENGLGEGPRSEIVSVNTEESVPSGPPEDIIVQATGSQSFKVSWKPPRKSLQHGKILGYYIGYKSDQGKDFQFKHVENVEGAETEIQSTYVTNLRPSTRYAVVVQSYNTAGPGPISDERFGTTLESAPPTSPKLKASLLDSSKIRVEWERDPKDRSIVTEFTLYYRAENGEWQQKKLSADETQMELEDLRCGTRYWFYITATNSLGTGEASESIAIRTAGAAPVSPSAETFIQVNSTSLTLHLWAWKSGGCPIQSFSVRYKLRYHHHWDTLSSGEGDQDRDLVIRQLLPSRDYVIQVTAQSQAGKTEAEYNFHTLASAMVATLSPDLSPSKMPGTAFHRNLTVFVPVLLSILVVVIVLVLAIVCLWKSRQDRNNTSTLDSTRSNKEPADENILMTELQTKKAAAEMRPKEGYYSSPSKHPTPVPASSMGNSHRREGHEYAEPYTAVPPPRRVSTDASCRPFMPSSCTHNMNDGCPRTFDRRLSRPESRTSLFFQGLSVYSAFRLPSPGSERCPLVFRRRVWGHRLWALGAQAQVKAGYDVPTNNRPCSGYQTCNDPQQQQQQQEPEVTTSSQVSLNDPQDSAPMLAQLDFSDTGEAGVAIKGSPTFCINEVSGDE